MKIEKYFVQLSILAILGVTILNNGCEKEKKELNEAPSCTFISPANNSVFEQGDIVTIAVDAEDRDGSITEVKFYIDYVYKSSTDSFPYCYSWEGTTTIHTHTVKATAFDNDGDSSSSEIKVSIITDIDTIADTRDNKLYKIVRIGKQVWMAENLNYDAGVGSWFYNDNVAYAEIYGRLYDWQTACNVCPDGWHLPKKSEWENLINYLGGREIAGAKMKETGILHWNSPNTVATNESGFTALPGGRYEDEYFGIGNNCAFWSATKYTSPWISICSYFVIMYNDSGEFSSTNSYVFVHEGFWDSRYSVRCIKDE